MADYEELIGAKFTINGFEEALVQFDAFIKAANEKGQQLKIGVSGNALDGVVKQLQEVKNAIGGLSGQFKDVFGTGADAAQDSTKSIKQSIADAESAFISAQSKQTEAAQSQSAKRIEIARGEASEIQKLDEKYRAADKERNQHYYEKTLNSANNQNSALDQEIQRLEKAKSDRLKRAASGDPLEGAGQYGSGVVEKEIARLETAQQKFAAARQAALKGAPSGDQFEGANTYGSSIVQKELDRIESERQARLKAPTQDRLAGANSYGSQFVANELKKLEEEKSNSGIGGFFKGVGTGLSPRGDSSAASIGEFLGEATRFVAAYAAIRVAAEAAAAAIKAPFEILKGGIEYLTEFQERSSQLKAALLDHGFFSKDPAQNLTLAGQAADALQEKIENLATKLNVKSQVIQSSFETFSSFGGNKLTANLNDSVDLAGIATGALQSQNPVIQQRTVATQLQKLTSGTLKDTDKLPAALGISADKLNEMAKGAQNTHDLLQQIEAQVPGIADRIGNANERFGSLVESAKLLGERLEGIIAKPVFDALSAQLKNLIEWINKNKDAINEFGTRLGEVFKDIEAAFVRAGTLGAPLLISALKQGVVLASEIATHIGNAANLYSAIHGTKTFSQAIQENRDANDRTDNINDNLTLSPERARENAKQRLSRQLADKYKADKGYLSDQTGFNKDYAAGAAQIDQTYNDRLHPKKSEGEVAISAYHPGGNIPAGKPAATNTSGDQIAAIRNSYSEQVSEIKKQSDAVRSAIEEDARNFRITLIDAADLKEATYNEETQKITAAGEKAKNALAKVAAGKDPAKTQNAKNSVIKSINENDLTVGLASAKSLTAGQDAISKQSDAVDAINQAGDQTRATDLLNADYAYKQELQKKGLITDTQALQNEQDYWDRLYKIRLDGIQKSIEAETKDSFGDPKKLAELNQQRQTLLVQQDDQNKKTQRQRDDLSYNERQRQFGLQVARDQADVEGAGNRADIDRHVGLVDTARRDNAALSGAQVGLLRTQQDQAVDTAEKVQQDFFKVHPDATNADLAANPAYQAAQNKVSVINAQLIKAEKLDAHLSDQGQSTEQAADALFGAGNNLTGNHFQGSEKGVFGDIAQSADSLGKLAGNIGKGVGAIEQGYQQGGAGGAVGAGLQQVGQFIPGPAGQLVSGVGSIVSLVSGLFSQVAQQIGKEVAKAVDQVMEKYSTGQSTLNTTLAAVQQQYNTLVAKETGKKGGQQVLDTEGVQLKQQIDQLKQQQQQTVTNFADQVVVSGGTNSVAQQWLQTWISVNKQVQDYKNAVGDAAAVQLANQYLNEQLDAQRKQLQDQYVQGQASAVNDALQYNQLLQQRNNYEDQYRQQVFSLQSQDSLARRGNPAEQTARQISLAKAQYNQQTQQLNFEISTYQQKVAYETQIFGLATTTADLQKQALTDQAYQLNEQVQQYQTIVALLASITGLTAVNGQIPGLSGLGITLPTNYGVNDGSLNPIPGYGAPGTVDNSTNTINITIPASALPATGTPTDFATAIGNQLAYRIRTRGVTATL